MTDRALLADRLERFLALSPRQQEIARRYAEGTARSELAYEMFMSDHTMRGQLNTIYRRLGIKAAGQNHHGRELAYLLGYVDGLGSRRLCMVMQKREAA